MLRFSQHAARAKQLQVQAALRFKRPHTDFVKRQEDSCHTESACIRTPKQPSNSFRSTEPSSSRNISTPKMPRASPELILNPCRHGPDCNMATTMVGLIMKCPLNRAAEALDGIGGNLLCKLLLLLGHLEKTQTKGHFENQACWNVCKPQEQFKPAGRGLAGARMPTLTHMRFFWCCEERVWRS